jgi:hypothetical protein
MYEYIRFVARELNGSPFNAAMKTDRKRLKLEKSDLVGQMKQLYGTLKDKEAELRDFIRNYEQRNRDMLDALKQVCTTILL